MLWIRSRQAGAHFPDQVTLFGQSTAAAGAASVYPNVTGAHWVSRPFLIACPFHHGLFGEVAAPYIYLSARRAGTWLPEPARHTPPRVPPGDRGQHLCRERLRRDSAVCVSRLGLGLDEPGVAQLVPAGLPSHGEPGERGGLLQASERQGTCRWPTLSPAPPRLRPSLLGLRLWRSSCLYSGKEAENQTIIPTILTSRAVVRLPPCQAALKTRNCTAIEKKQQKLTFSSLSLLHFAA